MFNIYFFFLVSIMEYQTSPMKWCESIYYYSDYIAEFWNTFTSLFFTFLPLYCYLDMFIWLFKYMFLVIYIYIYLIGILYCYFDILYY